LEWTSIALTTHDFTITADDTGQTIAIAVGGELDILTTPQLRVALDRAVGQGGDVVLDLAAVTFIDSTALHALIHAQGSLAATGQVLRLERPSVVVTRALGLTGLANRFDSVAPTDLPPPPTAPRPPSSRC
jgi:anti-sigma B factor antagonist